MGRKLAVKMALDALYFSGVQAASRYWTSGLGVILMLHRVRARKHRAFSPNGHLCVDPIFLEKLIRALDRRGFEFVSLDEVARRTRNRVERKHDRPFAALTLDDGYKDNLENAVPIFRKYKVPYAIFISTGLVDGNATLWWEDLEAIIASRPQFFMHSPKGNIEFDVPSVERKNAVFSELRDFLCSVTSEEQRGEVLADLSRQAGHDPQGHCRKEVMNWKQIADLNSDPLCTVGAHTINHYFLSRLTLEKARYEMEEGARVLELELGSRPRHFAYPYGFPEAAGTREFELAAELGFETASTTRHGVIYREHASHLMALPRISLSGHFQSVRYVDTLLSGIPTRMKNFGGKLNVA